ncbi:hypothetical protein Plo01_45830 [Planobispora longispora]|uniref:Uncharacterized protein n=1 Tax=Planobispora longispora TaxID=28887 RepID=A0A8J3W657_9ACTN|nr:hypothetical protein Plo01_45830 [Planobispora longispora]
MLAGSPDSGPDIFPTVRRTLAAITPSVTAMTAGGVWALIAGPGPSALERKTLKSIKVRVERVGMTARQPC